jgi:hypothetical protein
LIVDTAEYDRTQSAHQGATVESTFNSTAPKRSQDLSRLRSSEVLRGILTKNPGVKSFSIERILAAIGPDRVEASMMMFALPCIVPVSTPPGMVTATTSALACQVATGRNQIRLPARMLAKSVSRRTLAIAIHAIMPVLEAAERVVRPRWSWVVHPLARRAIGLFVFLLGVAIAYPLSGFKELHAISVFVVSLGMAERDGLAVTIGVVAGMLSLAILAGSGLSLRVIRSKFVGVLRGIGKKLGLSVIANFLDRLGYTRLARLVTFDWADALLAWDPEKDVGTQAEQAAVANQAARADAAPAATADHLSTQDMTWPIRKVA